MIIDNNQAVSKATSDPAIKKLFNDLQGNILKSHAREHVQLLFVKFDGPATSISSWIRQNLIDKITSFAQQIEDTKAYKMQRTFEDPGFCSFSLSAKGYGMLQINVDDKDESFRNGMASGSVTNDPAKDDWEVPYQDSIHALIILAHASRTELGKLVQSVKISMGQVATVVAEENGQALLGEKEHFGFADGRSQPRFMAEDLADEGNMVNWNPFAPLNLVLEKDNLGKAFNSGFTGLGDEPSEPDNATHSYGSYLVFRKLEQDVDGWNEAVVRNSNTLSIDPGLFGAYAVGRFQDGTPVVQLSTSSGSMTIDNDFDYKNDPDALKCPFHAHIRKVNPRGGTSKFGVSLEDEKKRRIARRGIPYEMADGKKGLLFMCYQSSIITQFEFMQDSWADNSNFLNPATGTDSVIGQGAVGAKDWPTVYGQPAKTQLTFGHFVTLKGGEYFYTPSLSFLRAL